MDCEFESKTHLLAILDNMPFMAWYKDDKGRFIAVNLPFAEVCGSTKKDLIGKTDFDIWPYERALNYTNEDLEVMRTKEKKSFEQQVDDHKGNGTWFEIFKSPVFDDDGNVIGVMGMAKDISKRKHFQLELENQSDYSKMLLQTVPSGVYSIDTNRIITSWNDMAEKITGYTADEVMGKCADLFNFHPCRENCKLCINKFSAPESNLTVQIKNKNGDIRYLRKNIDVLKNDLGEIIGGIECFDDITENVLVEKQLNESEMRLNLATSNAMIGLWDWNLQTGNIIYNEQWANIIGYTLNELQPISIQTWIKNTHPDDLKKSNNLLLKHFNGELEYYENEIRLKHKNGQWIWVLDRGKVIEWDSEKNPIRMVGTHIDITQRKLIEEELKRKEKILSAAAFSIKELIENRDYLDAISKCFELLGTATQVNRIYLFVNTYDDQGIYTSQKLEWNSEPYKSQLNNSKFKNIPFENLNDLISILKNNNRFYGFTKELKNCKIKELLECRDTLSFIILPIFVEKVFWGFLGFDECKYERYWTEAEVSTLSTFSTSIGKTIERNLIETTLETSRQNAETANMLKSQFLANMSHEIRTPMHAILGYASLMKDMVKNEEILNYLNSIQKAGNMLMNLINDILDLSKIEAGKLELQTGYVDIRRLFDDIKEIFSLKIEEKNIKVHMHIDPKVPKTVLMDEVRIRQILFNLVGNAVKFTDEGSINISAYVSSFNEKSNLLSLTFKVQDTGIGIPEDQQSSIFNPFKQKDGQNNKKYGGTGLGLSISKKLIDIMNGSLSLNSKVDEGSTFTIEIPNISIGSLNNTIDESQILNFEEQLNSSITTTGVNEVEIKGIEAINPEMVKKIATLKDGLWLDCINKNRVSNIKKLAGLILDIGSEYNHKDTIEYAKLLQSYINSFDLKNTKELLKQYPTILEVYKSNIIKE